LFLFVTLIVICGIAPDVFNVTVPSASKNPANQALSLAIVGVDINGVMFNT